MGQVVRIGRQHHIILRQIAESMGASMQAVVEIAIDDLKRKQFFEEMDNAYSALRADEAAWKEELNERALWESTLQDGLDAEAAR